MIHPKHFRLIVAALLLATFAGAQGSADADETVDAALQAEPGAGEATSGAKDAAADEPDKVSVIVEELVALLTDPAESRAEARAEEAEGFGDDELWVFPPKRNRKVIDHREVEVRYRKQTYEKPIYAYRKETHVVTVPVKDENGYIIGQKKVKKQRVVERKKIGSETKTRLVRDPKGPITKTENRRVYGPGGPDEFQGEALGNNGMALWALARAGAAEDVRGRLEQSITTHLYNYGLPDRTRELAWLVLGLAEHSAAGNEDHIRAAAAKLMTGQVIGGRADGLWGPVSVDPRRLQFVLDVSDRMNAAAQEIAKDNDELQDRAHRMRREMIQMVAYTVAREAFWTRGTPEFKRVKIYPVADGLDESDNVPALLPPLPHSVIKSQWGDYESTALAAAALAAAHRAQMLPDRVDKLEINSRITLRESPVAAAAVNARLVSAVARLQRTDGSWPGYVLDNARRDNPGAAVTLTSHLLGVSTLKHALTLPGGDRLERKINANLQNAQTWLDPKLKQLTDFNKLADDGAGKYARLHFSWQTEEALEDGTPLGGRNSFWSMAMAMRLAGHMDEATRRVMADYIDSVGVKSPDWIGGKVLIMEAPSTMALTDLQQRNEKKRGNVLEYFREAMKGIARAQALAALAEFQPEPAAAEE